MNPLRHPIKAAGVAIGAAVSAVKSFTLSSVQTLAQWGLSAYNALGWGASSYRRIAALAAQNPHASRGLRLIADNAAAAPLVVMKRDGEEESALTDHPVLARLSAHWSDLAEFAVWALYCGGRGYIEITGTPTTGANAYRLDYTGARLRFWRPDEVQDVRRDAAGDATAYVFRGYQGRTVTANAAAVLALRTFDPLGARGDESGCPILLGGKRAMLSAEAAEAWNRTLSASGGRLEGFMMPEGLRPGDTVDLLNTREAQADLDARLSETKARGSWHVMTGNYRPVPAALSPKDADFLKKLLLDMEHLAAVLGVPPSLLAHPKAGSLTDAGVDSEVRALLLLTVLPFARRHVLGPLSAWLLPDGERFDVNESEIGALQENEDARWRRYGEAYRTHELLTREEAREALNKPPVPEIGAFPLPAPVAPAVPESPGSKSVADYLGTLPAELWDPREMAAKIAAEA